MADYNEPFIYANIHDFKSNIAKYLRMLERGSHDAVFIKRYDKVVAFVCPYERRIQEVRDERAARDRETQEREEVNDWDEG